MTPVLKGKGLLFGSFFGPFKPQNRAETGSRYVHIWHVHIYRLYDYSSNLDKSLFIHDVKVCVCTYRYLSL